MTEPLVFRTSRVDSVVTAFFLFALAAGFGCWAGGLLATAILAHKPADFLVGVIVACFACFFLYLGLRAASKVIQPDSLALSRDGWVTTTAGHASSYRWSEFDVPTKYVTHGRAGSSYIRMMPKEGGEPVLMPAGIYSKPFDLVMLSVQMARTVNLGF